MTLPTFWRSVLSDLDNFTNSNDDYYALMHLLALGAF